MFRISVATVRSRITNFMQNNKMAAAHIAQNIAQTCQKYFHSFIAIAILS